VTGKSRAGDIRHCFADVSLAEELLGYRPEIEFEDGLRELAGWLESQTAVDRVAQARHEPAERGLSHVMKRKRENKNRK